MLHARLRHCAAGLAFAALLLDATLAAAASHIRGQVTAIAGDVATVRTTSGETVDVTLKPDFALIVYRRIALADLEARRLSLDPLAEGARRAQAGDHHRRVPARAARRRRGRVPLGPGPRQPDDQRRLRHPGRAGTGPHDRGLLQRQAGDDRGARGHADPRLRGRPGAQARRRRRRRSSLRPRPTGSSSPAAPGSWRTEPCRRCDGAIAAAILARTGASNASPRASKLANWSKLAQAGASSTVSPSSASASAAATAASSVPRDDVRRRRRASPRTPRPPRRSGRPWRPAGTAAAARSMPPAFGRPPAIQRMRSKRQQRLLRRVGVGRLANR